MAIDPKHFRAIYLESKADKVYNCYLCYDKQEFCIRQKIIPCECKEHREKKKQESK